MKDIKIILVEDENIQAMDLKNTLKSLGYTVPYVASNAIDAVKKTVEIMPDLILMDIILKGEGDGIEAASQIKKFDIPIIYLTAHSEDQTIERAKLTEPYGYIIKPYNRSELKHTIELAIYKNKMEKELKESEANLRFLTEKMNDIMWIQDLNLNTTYVNSSIKKILGFTPEERMKQPPQEQLTPESLSKAQTRLKKELMLEENPHSDPERTIKIELEYYHKDGSTRWLENLITSIRDEKGNLIGLHGVSRDVSDRKQLENERKQLLKESQRAQNELFILIENIVDEVFFCDKNGDIVLANAAARKFMENANLEKIKPLNNIIKSLNIYDSQGNPRPKEGSPLLRSLNGEIIKDLEEIVVFPGSDKKYYRQVSSSPIKNEDGEIISAVAVVRDITGLKKTENERFKSQEFLRNILENIPDMVFVKNATKLDLVMINKAGEELLGIRRDELIGKTDYELFPKNDADFFTSKDREVLENKTLLDIPEEVIETKNLGQRILHTKKIPILNHEGTPQYLLGISEDITKLKKSEKKIKESEEFLRGIFDNMPSGMSVYQVKNNGSKGSDYIIKEFNQASEKIEGMPRESVIGKSLYDIRPNIDEYGIIPIFKKVWETGKPIHYPAKMYVDEKYENWYENYVFKAPTGEIVAIYNDVTAHEKAKEELIKESAEKTQLNKLLKAEIKERKKMEKIIQDNVLRMNIALESAKMGAWDFNLVNNTSVRTLDHDKIFGYDSLQPEWNKKIFFEHVLPEDREYAQKRFEESYETNKLYLQCRIIRADKKIRWIEVYGIIYRDDKNHPNRILGVISDITERKETENHLIKAIEEKEILLREIHHRVKNNMQIISSFLNLQSIQVVDKRDADLFTVVQDRVKSMALIHDNLYQSVDLSRIQFKEYINNMISQIFSTHSHLSKNIKLVTDIDDLTFNMETGVPLGLIITEMVINSLKHAFPDYKGEIFISLHAKEEYIELIIRDNGVGIPEDFDIEKSKKLGLRLLNTLVDQLEGTVKLDCSQGTEFKITFKELKYTERL
ncbi:MAG: PAS domain S-box protein [Methanobacteriaceae archaeon]|nr:PAS domain S-box protein [Methanobacteriaceae archaeon]